MALFVYVDNSNIWIEGMRVSAARKGLAASLQDAMDRQILDRGWSYDFGCLYSAVCPDTAQIGRSSLFGSRPPPNDSLWALAEEQGFEVHVFDRSFGREKEVDVAIATQMTADSYEYMKHERGDRVVLVSGDRDYVPTIEHLAKRGFKTTVVFWEHATAVDLRTVADFFALDPLFEYVSGA
jgi:NYN domain-containing protein